MVRFVLKSALALTLVLAPAFAVVTSHVAKGKVVESCCGLPGSNPYPDCPPHGSCLTK
jgi:hypothetical protein